MDGLSWEAIYTDVIQSAVYGKCIFADYNNVHKDMCAKEFMKLKECYLVSSACVE